MLAGELRVVGDQQVAARTPDAKRKDGVAWVCRSHLSRRTALFCYVGFRNNPSSITTIPPHSNSAHQMTRTPVLELVAIGPQLGQRWRRRFPKTRWVRLGRSPSNGWAVPWDMRVSREHVDLIIEGERLRVRRTESATNAVFLNGAPRKEFSIGAGESFRIGETTFRLVDATAADSNDSRPTASQTNQTVADTGDLRARNAASRRTDQQRLLNESRNSAVVALKAEARALTAQMTASAKAQKKAAALKALKADIESLKREMAASSEARRKADDDARQTEQEVQQQREVEDLARQKAEEAVSLLDVQKDALRKTEERVRLQIQEAESRLEAEKHLKLREEEAQALKVEVDQLKARLARQVEDQRKLEEHARHQAEEAEKRRRLEEAVREKLEEAARLKAEEAEARVKAEQAAKKNAEEVERVRAEAADLKAQLEREVETQHQAQAEAERQAALAEAAREAAEEEARRLDGELENLKAEELETLRKAEGKEQEALTLRQEVEALRAATDKELTRAREDAAAESQRLAEEAERQRRAEDEARKRNEEEIRRKAEEADLLKAEVKALRKKMENEWAARRQAEEHAAKRSVEARTLRDQFQQLQEQLQQADESLHAEVGAPKLKIQSEITSSDAHRRPASSRGKTLRAGKRRTADQAISPQTTESNPSEIDPRKDDAHSAKPAEEMLIQAGEGYRLVERLGEGEYGEVWRAMAPGGVEVAVKRIRFPLGHRATQVELDALDLIKGLRHLFLLQVQAYWLMKDQLVIVMELADSSLEDRVNQCRQDGGGIPRDELCRYMLEAAEAIDYLHEQGVLHRDIKPANILLMQDHVKVGDFGIAAPSVLGQGELTTNTVTIGTPLYMAPEVWDKQVGPRSDQYSLAVSYVELREGAEPEFDKQSQVDLSSLPENEQRVLRRALNEKPSERFESCTKFAQALEAVARRKRHGVLLPWHRKWMAVSAGVLLLLALLVGWWILNVLF